MTKAADAICLSCNTTISLSEEVLDTLSKSGSAHCSECGGEVTLRVDPNAERDAKATVITLTLGSAVVGVVALINVIGNAGFPTYYVAIPFLLISALIVSSQSGKALELEAVAAPATSAPSS